MRRRLIRRAVFIGSLLLITLVGGTIGVTLIDGLPIFDAFYMTLTTITTVGYTEVFRLSRAGRIFNAFLILFGVSIMFTAVGAITQTIIEVELQDPYGRRRRKKMIQDLHDHLIVCGFGRVGRNASFELQRAGVPFIVIDRNDERVERAMLAGMLAVVADATRDDCLREAGVMRARGLVAALPSDAENLFIILSAKTLNPKLNVVTRASEEESGEKLRRAGADTVFAPYTMAGQRLAHALVRPHVVEFLDFANNPGGPRIMMEQVRILPGAEFDTKTLRDMHLRRDLGVILLAIRKADGKMLFNPPLDTSICADDHLIVIGEQHSLHQLEKVLTRSH